MPKLTSPTGVTVNVSDEKAEQLRSVGYKSAAPGGVEKSSDKKSASSKSEK